MKVSTTREDPALIQTNPTPIALQLWTVRDLIADNTDQALASIKAAGFSAVEIAPLPPELTPERLAELLGRHGLRVVSIHGELPTAGNIGELERLGQLLQCSKLIWHGWPRDPRFDSLEGVRSLIENYNDANALARDYGFQFGLHNHWWEFEPVQGKIPIRMFHEQLSSEIFWQLDVYWARTAGADPASVLRSLEPRVRSIHWKDGPAVHGQPMISLGQGVLDLPGILETVSGFPPADWIIELDECATDSLEAARKGLAYLEGVDLIKLSASA